MPLKKQDALALSKQIVQMITKDTSWDDVDEIATYVRRGLDAAYVEVRKNEPQDTAAIESRVTNMLTVDINRADEEPLLKDNGIRYVPYPELYPKYMKRFKNAMNAFWSSEIVDLSKDTIDKLDRDARASLLMILAFFAAADGVVNQNLVDQFLKEIKVIEIILFLGIQVGVETVHMHTYGQLIYKYVPDETERHQLFTAMNNTPSIAAKIEYATLYMNTSIAFGERVVAFAVVEGVQFSSSFAYIYWIREQPGNVLPGLCFSNDEISKDEGSHMEESVEMFSDIVNKPSKERVLEIVKAGVKVEEDFVADVLKVKLLGMNKEKMVQYVHFVADRLLLQLGNDKHYNESNPFPFMDKISMEGKTNFFEKQVPEYSRIQQSDTPNGEKVAFVLDDDFDNM